MSPGGRRPCSAQPDRTSCLQPPHEHGLKLATTRALLYRAIRLTAYLQSSPHGKRKIWESGQCAIREETAGTTQGARLDLHVFVGAFWSRDDISSWIGARNKRAVPQHAGHSRKEFRLRHLRIDARSLNSATIIVTSFFPPLTKRRSAYMHSAVPNK